MATTQSSRPAADTAGLQVLTTVTATLGSGQHIRKIDRVADLKKPEVNLVDTLLIRELHPEVHRLLLLSPLRRLEFAVAPKRDEGVGEVRLAVRLEAGKQFGHPDGNFVAQQQDTTQEALWLALHHKFGMHVYQRLRAASVWLALDGVSGLYQSARQQGLAVSRQALASEPLFFAETFAVALTQQHVSEELSHQRDAFLALLLRI